MGGVLNIDFKEFIEMLNMNGVRYLLVGGYSVVLYGYPRTTGDLDIWVDQTRENYQKLVRVYQKFGLPLDGFTEQNFISNSDIDVFTYGVPPVAIDIMIKCKGLDFNKAYERSKWMNVDGIQVKVVSKSDLLTAKKASGRPKDMDDLENLNSK